LPATIGRGTDFEKYRIPTFQDLTTLTEDWVTWHIVM